MPKIAVARQVWAEYDASWKKLRNSSPLPDTDWGLLIAVLLAYAIPNGGNTGITRGMELKNLNAAMQAIDVADERLSVPHLDVLRQQASMLF